MRSPPGDAVIPEHGVHGLDSHFRLEREFLIDNLLVRIHVIIEMIWWTGLAPWEFEFPFPGSLISTFPPRRRSRSGAWRSWPKPPCPAIFASRPARTRGARAHAPVDVMNENPMSFFLVGSTDYSFITSIRRRRSRSGAWRSWPRQPSSPTWASRSPLSPMSVAPSSSSSSSSFSSLLLSSLELSDTKVYEH